MKNTVFGLAAFVIFSCTSPRVVQNAARQTSISQLVSDASTYSYLEDFQKIADSNGNVRAVGSPGGQASADYIFSKLKSFGLNPSLQEFTNEKGAAGQNVIVEIKGKTDSVVMFGAHFDSVEQGPGINDNASGVAILLEMVYRITQNKIVPNRTVRVAFWDSEEVNINGSRFYVANLSAAEKQRISQYVNIDMASTVDPTVYILDGDGSFWKSFDARLAKNPEFPAEQRIKLIADMKKGSPVQKTGAGPLEEIVTEFCKANGMKYMEDFSISLGTDVYPFLGIVPTAGIVFINEREIPGGGILYTPCYHQACDNIGNVDRKALKLGLNSVAFMADRLIFN